MRPIAFVLSLGIVSLSVGCSAFHGNKVTDPNVKPVARAGGVPKAEDLVHSLNENAQRVRNLKTDVKIDGKFDNMTSGIDGLMAYERTYAPGSTPTPPNFRLMAQVFSKTEVDLGSNSQEFWFHTPEGLAADYRYCSYTDFRANRAQLPFPVQPEWIVEALGVADYDPKADYTVEQDKTTWQLVEKAVNSQGQTVYKVTSFSKVPAKNNPYPVISRVLLDSTRKNMIYTAAVVRNQTDPKSGAIVPAEVKLIWPRERIELSMRLEQLQVNNVLSREEETRLFSRQSLGEIPTVNLARREPQLR